MNRLYGISAILDALENIVTAIVGRIDGYGHGIRYRVIAFGNQCHLRPRGRISVRKNDHAGHAAVRRFNGPPACQSVTRTERGYED